MFKTISGCEVMFRMLYSTWGKGIVLGNNNLPCLHLLKLDSPFQKPSLSNYTSKFEPKDTTDSSISDTFESPVEKELKDQFSCSSEEVEFMLENYPPLSILSRSNARGNVECLKRCGFVKETLINHPWILDFKERSHLMKKLDYALLIYPDINVSAPLLQLSVPKLKEISINARKETNLVPERNKIDYLSSELECQPADIAEIAARYPFLFNLPYTRLKPVLRLLKDAGVKPEAILKDPWVFRYNITRIEERLHQAKEADLPKIKPWVVRCPEITFRRTIERHVTSRELLGTHQSVVGYLSQRLECSPEMVEFILQKTPQLKSVHVSKLKEILDFLFEEGFTPQQVCQVPRIVNHKLETLQTRLTQLRNLGYNPHSLIILCQSKRILSELIEKLTRGKIKQPT